MIGLAQCSVTHGDTMSPPSLRVELENSIPLGATIVTSEVPIQEGSRSLATDKITSNYMYSSFDWTDHVDIILSQS